MVEERRPIAYTVICEFSDPDLVEPWIAWLCKTHLADVLAAGALDAEVIRLDNAPGHGARQGDARGSVHYEVRYHFASRADFERYEREHAPCLRQEGLERFPVERGLTYQRRVGSVLERRGGR